MKSFQDSQTNYVVAADGSVLTPASLPVAGTYRWTIALKANVVAAVRGGLIDLTEACTRYSLSVEEFSAWSQAVDQFGISGLSATRVQKYRKLARQSELASSD